jgi:hypothetical protein
VNKDLFLDIKYYYIEDFSKSAILLSKMPFWSLVFVGDKNIKFKSCEKFLKAHYLKYRFSNKLPLGLC